MSGIDKYAVFGNPIKHSKSPVIHSAFARQCGRRLQYRAVLVKPDGFERAAQQFFEDGGAGLNITLPFKREAFAFADRLSSRAQRAGAVNTLSLGKDGAIQGENTDGIGLVRDMIANLGWAVQGLKVLIVGAGGAARGVLEPLLREKPQRLLVVNRTPEKAAALAHEFVDLGAISGGSYSLIGDESFDLIINASSAGLSGQTPPLPGSVLNERSCCYDMIYGSGPTAFMRWAAKNAAWAVADGLGMLVEQAAQSFYIWQHQLPETRPVIAQVRESLA
ncbi:MAG: shikimate dehydrogenase [Pseudomonadota bacterium]